MATIAELVTKFTAETDQFLHGVKKVREGTEGVGDGAGKTEKKILGLNSATIKTAIGMAGLAVGISSVSRVLKTAIKVFGEYEQSMANVRAVTKATDEEFLLLNLAAKNAGETTRFSANQAAEALYFLASAGLSAKESVEALEGVLLLAGATGANLATTAETMTAIISQYDLRTEESTRVSNVFAAAIANSQATMDKLRNAFIQVGPVAAGMGVSLEETTGALQVLFNAGFRGQQAGRALKSALADLANESGVASQKLEALGVSFKDIDPTTVGFSNSIDALSKAGLSTAAIIDVFGKVAGPQLSVLIRKGKRAIDEYTEAVTDTNEAAEQYAIQNDTLKNDLDILKSVTQAVAIEFGEGLEPVLRLTIQAVTGLIKLFKPMVQIISDLIGVAGWLSSVTFKALGDSSGLLGTQLTKSINSLDKLTVGIRAATKESWFFSGSIKDIGDHIKIFRKRTDEATAATDALAEAQNVTAVQLSARLSAQKEFIEIMKQQIRLEEELALREAYRIAGIIDAREAAAIAYSETTREIKASLELGIISQKQFNDKMVSANEALIASILKVGIEANYANLVDDPVLKEAVNRINELTKANEELANTEEDLIRKGVSAKDAYIQAQEASKNKADARKRANKEEKDSAEALKQVYLDIALGIPGQVSAIFSALSTLRESRTDAEVQALEAEAAARIAAGEDELEVREDIEKKKAAIEYKGALAAWRLQLAGSLASGAQVILNGFLTKPFIPAGLIAGALATALAGLQIAAVKKAKPVKNFAIGTQGFTVPEGFPNDTYQAGLTSGERFKVETPNQQASNADGLTQTIAFYVGETLFYKMTNRGIASRKIRIPA